MAKWGPPVGTLALMFLSPRLGGVGRPWTLGPDFVCKMLPASNRPQSSRQRQVMTIPALNE